MPNDTENNESRTVIPTAEDHKWHEEMKAKQTVSVEAPRLPPTQEELIKLGDMAKHFAPWKPTESVLMELGFKPVMGMMNAKFYDRRDLGAMLLKAAERFLANRKDL